MEQTGEAKDWVDEMRFRRVSPILDQRPSSLTRSLCKINPTARKERHWVGLETVWLWEIAVGA